MPISNINAQRHYLKISLMLIMIYIGHIGTILDYNIFYI